MQEILNQNIVEELGITSLPEPEKIKILERIGRLIYQSVIIRVLEKLNEDAQDEFERIVDIHSETPEGAQVILDFLKSKVEDLDNLVAEEVASFKRESLSAMSGIS